MKRVTVLTITYNRDKYNIASINSILFQSYQDFHYIVVNDGSTDNTQEVLDSIAHPNLTVIHQPNKGFTNTLVDTLKEITTPYIAIHDSGDISHNQRLEKQVNLLENDESLGAVGCHLKSVTYEGEIIRSWYEKTYLKNPIQNLIKDNYFSHGEVMFRTSAYHQVGGYRRFFKYAQDYDLWLRIGSFYNLARVDECLYYQISFPTSSVMSDYRKVEMQGKLSAFAAYLAQQRLAGKPDELQQLGEEAFNHFINELSQEVKNSISERIISSGILNYRMTKRHQLLLESAKRAIEFNPQNLTASKYFKLAQLVIFFDKIRLESVSNLINNQVIDLLNKKRKASYSLDSQDNFLNQYLPLKF